MCHRDDPSLVSREKTCLVSPDKTCLVSPDKASRFGSLALDLELWAINPDGTPMEPRWNPDGTPMEPRLQLSTLDGTPIREDVPFFPPGKVPLDSM